MGFTDRLLYEWFEYKRLAKFPLRICLYIVAASFVVASLGTSAISYWFSPLSFISTPPTKPPTVSTWQEKVTLTDVKIKSILSRNLFNREGEVPEEENSTSQVYTGLEAIKSMLPFSCIGLIYAGDPHSGIAVMEDTAKHVANSFFVGDLLGADATVSEILSDRVIVERAGHREYFQLERNLNLDKKRKKKGAGNSANQGFATEPPPDKYKEDGFERQGTASTVSTDFRTKLLGDLSKVLQDAKAEPNLVGNELQGFRLTRIRKDSIFEKLGLQNDDIVREVNGSTLSDAAQSVKLLNSLRGESDVEFRVDRGGKQMTFNLQTK